jgi:hypothetical protein
MILLAASNKDPAGLNIARQVLDHYPFKITGKAFQGNPVYLAQVNRKKVTLIILSQESINTQNLPENFPNLKLIVWQLGFS